MSHTEGKLVANGNVISIENDGVVCYIDTGDFHGDRDNARRLVACWNALDGVPTEWLENYVAGGVENLLQENAALKAEVERLRKWAETWKRYTGEEPEEA